MKLRGIFTVFGCVVSIAIISLQNAAAQARNALCDQPLPRTHQEKLTCQSYELHSLDAGLNRFFETVMFFSKNSKKIRSDQRNWLQHERSKCDSAACLVNAYRSRILELQKQIAASTVPSGKGIDSDNVEQVCREILALADRKLLRKHEIPALPFSTEPKSAAGSIVLQLAKGKPQARFTSTFTGGTCWSSELRNDAFVKNGLLTLEEVNDSNDDLRWSWWGAGDYPAYVNGRFFSLTARGDPNLLNLISWIRPDGHIQPLCSVKQSIDRVLTSNSTDALCAKLESSDAETPNWEPSSDDVAALEPPPLGTAYIPTAAVATIALGSSGEKYELAKFSVDSGAGCGAHVEWLRVVDTANGKLLENALDKALLEIGQGNEISLSKVAGGLYVTSVGPSKEGAAFRISNGGHKKVCEYTWASSSRISRVW